MAERDAGRDAGEPISQVASRESDEAAYRDGYRQMMRAAEWARDAGWTATQRQITVALMRTIRVYAAVRRGKVIAGQRPEWLRGQADALRELVRQGVGDVPDGD